MVLLRNVKQINDAVNELFEIKLFNDEEDKFIFSMLDDSEIKIMVQGACNLSAKKVSIEDLSDLIFQLKDYIPALCNITKMFLYSANYEAVYFFVKKLFIAHIGNIVYQSTNGPYNITERYFDRFVEIVKNCQIPHEAYVPLLLEVFKTDKIGGLCNWREPAIEYLQTFFNKNEEWAMTFLKDNLDLKYNLLEAIAKFNTPKGLKMVIDDYASRINVDNTQVFHILKKYKRDTLIILDKEIAESNEERKLALIEILCNFDNDIEAKTRLLELYSKEDNEQIKVIIASKIGIVESLSIKNEKQFLSSARKKITEPQERSMGIGFDKMPLKFTSGFELDNGAKTFLIYMFKEERNLLNLSTLSVVKNFINNEDLDNFALMLFNALTKKDDVNQAKWVLRMSALLLSDANIYQLVELCELLVEYDRFKEAKYILQCLIYAQRDCALNVLTLFANSNKNELVESIETFAKIYSDRNSISLDEVLDYLVPDIYDTNELEKQKKRLFYSFIAERTYDEAQFNKLFIKKPLFKELGLGLVFGEYVLGNLYSAFVIENNEKKYLVGDNIQADNKRIGIIHSLDIDSRFVGITSYIKNPTFDQFVQSRFNVTDFSRSSISVNRFCGMFVNIEQFTNKIKKYGFMVNKAFDEIEFQSYIHIMPNLNICCELLLEKATILVDVSDSLAEVHFMRLEDILQDKNKYITAKANSISVGSLPYRYFDYVLNAIYESAQN